MSRRRLALGAALLAVVGGLVQAVPDRGISAEPATPASGDFAGRVSIGGRRIYLECRGDGAPLVILVTGLRGRGDAWSFPETGNTGEAVFPQLARQTRTCTYDRPGTVLGAEALSRSDPVPMPRTAGDAVSELHALLSAAELPPPYVITGSSTGGLIGRLYASSYPGEVAGLVMVDAISEKVPKAMTRRQFGTYNRRYLLERSPELASYQDLETIDFPLSFAQMRQAGVRPPNLIPFAVISKKRRFGRAPGLTRRFSRALERAWRAGQRYLASLVPGTRWTVAQQSGHRIADRQPGIVVGEAAGVIVRVRGG